MVILPRLCFYPPISTVDSTSQGSEEKPATNQILKTVLLWVCVHSYIHACMFMCTHM